MKAKYLLIGMYSFLLPLLNIAQERELILPQFRSVKSVTGFEPTLVFNQKYVPGDTSIITFDVNYNDVNLNSIELVFPAGTEILAASPIISSLNASVNLTSTITSQTITWNNASGIDYNYTPLLGTIKIVMPLLVSGDQSLACKFIGESLSGTETVQTTALLQQLSSVPLLELSSNAWYAGIIEVGSSSTSDAHLLASNQGLGTLSINDITGLSTPFSNTTTFPLNISSQNSAPVSIAFSSETGGYFNGNAVILSNGGNKDITVSGAAYNSNWEVIDFNLNGLQFPPVGWTVETLEGSGWNGVNSSLQLSSNGGSTPSSSLFISPAINLFEFNNPFIGFNIGYSPSYIWHIELLYSTDNKQTWITLEDSIYATLGESGQYYRPLNDVSGEQVYFAIKGVVESGTILLDNLVIPDYYRPRTAPEPAKLVFPANNQTDVTIAANIAWDKVLFAQGYKLYLDTLENPVKFYDLGDVNRFQANLEQLKYYYWKVVPYNEFGDADTNEVWSFKTEQFVPTSWTDNTDLNTQITISEGSKYNPLACSTSDGNTYFTWRSYEDGNVNMKMQLLNVDGHELLRRNGINISTHKQASFFSQYTSTVDYSDNLITAFCDIRNGGIPKAYVYKMSPKGEFLWGENGIAVLADGDVAYNPTVKVDTANNVYVAINWGYYSSIVKYDSTGLLVWEQPYTSVGALVSWKVTPSGELYLLTSNANKLYLDHLSTNLDRIYTEPVVVSTNPQFSSSGGTKNASLEIDIHNGVYVTWQAANGNQIIIKWQYVNADQTVALAPGGALVSNNQVRGHAYPRTVYHAKSDKLFVTWDEKGATLNCGLYAQRMNNKGVMDFGDSGKAVIELGDSIAGTDALTIKGDTIMWFFSNYDPGTAFLNYLNVMFLNTDMNLFDEMESIRYSSIKNNKPLGSVTLGKTQAVMCWMEDKNDEVHLIAQNLLYDGTMGILGPDMQAPYAKKTQVLSNEKLMITFNEQLFIDSAQMNAHYWITGAGNPVVTYSELYSETKVLLKISGLVTGNYKLYMKNMTDVKANTNALDSIEFNFVPDSTFPAVVLAQPVAQNRIVIRYSESISEPDLTQVSNFELSGANILSISKITADQIVLHTDTLVEQDYTLTIHKVTDLMENQVIDTVMTINYANNSGNLTYFNEDFSQGIPSEFSLYDVDQATPILSSYFDNAWVALATENGNIYAASTSYYEPEAQADDWMVTGKIGIQKNAYLFWDAVSVSAQFSEGYQIWVSTTGFTPSDFKIKVFEIAEEHYIQTNRWIDLSQFGFGDEPIYVAFRNHTNNKYILLVDNLSIYTPYNTDIELESTSVPTEVLGGSKLDVIATINALGINTISSFDLNWSFNNGPVNVNRFNNLNLVMGQSTKVQHANQVTVPNEAGTYTLKIWTSNPNNVTDQFASNDTITLFLNVNQGFEQRLVLLEHFTNTDCGPCSEHNPVLDELLTQNGNADKVLHLSYHVWWPGINDPFFQYNKKDVIARKDYYAVSSAPSVSVDGNKSLVLPSAVTQETINEEYAKPGLIKIQGGTYYMADSTTMQLDLKLTNLADFGLNTPTVFAVIAQDFEYGVAPGSNGETYFPGVVRDIITNNLGDGFTNTDSAGINRVSYHFAMPDDFVPNDAYVGVFVQDKNTGEVFMASKILPTQAYTASIHVASNGSALAGVEVMVGSNVFVTNADGNAVATFLPNGTYEIGIRHQGYQAYQGTFNINNANTDVDIDLKYVGIESTSAEKVTLYPNPAVDYLTVKAMSAIESVSVIDISGKELMHTNADSNNLTINVQELHPGYYYLIVRNKNQTSKLSFIITK